MYYGSMKLSLKPFVITFLVIFLLELAPMIANVVIKHESIFDKFFSPILGTILLALMIGLCVNGILLVRNRVTKGVWVVEAKTLTVAERRQEFTDMLLRWATILLAASVYWAFAIYIIGSFMAIFPPGITRSAVPLWVVAILFFVAVTPALQWILLRFAKSARTAQDNTQANIYALASCGIFLLGFATFYIIMVRNGIAGL